MEIYPFLTISHIVGIVLGVGGATFAEFLYLRALKDGVVDAEEKIILDTTYRIIRIGLFLAVISGFGFLLLFRFTGAEERLLDPKLWAKMSIVIILAFNAVLLTMHKIPFWLGSSLSLTSWYAALILGSWRPYPYSFMETIIAYVIAVFVVAYILHLIRSRFLRKS
ncbi:MAG: hypothetical protein QF858_02845 [Candidatus Pacebacteria bacterium]|jgi:hypothetical protein|nr:hypothetical protein [bacterium]MDP6527792.1 hypothetical protein [Candidatus Paceibacterota bacterium]MDP6659629.1 hypothetical protein [Candidatus Paceibacterota bacterium]|tara:strand:- start:55785 stop:56282 length:498 start_codon:yes stop_codon:yes gene_type:complete